MSEIRPQFCCGIDENRQPSQVAFYSAMPHDKEVYEKMSEESCLAACA